MRVQWLGDHSDADRTMCFGMEFRKGKPVEINDEALLAKARGNPTFKVEDEAPKAKGQPRGRPRRRHTKH